MERDKVSEDERPRSLRKFAAQEEISKILDETEDALESGEFFAIAESGKTPPARKSTSSMEGRKDRELEKRLGEIDPKHAWNILYLSIENLPFIAEIAVSGSPADRELSPPLKEILEGLSEELQEKILSVLERLLDANEKFEELDEWDRKPTPVSNAAMEIVAEVNKYANDKPGEISWNLAKSRRSSKPPSSSSGRGILRKKGGIKKPEAEEGELGRSKFQFSSSRRIRAAEKAEKLTVVDRIKKIAELIQDENTLLRALLEMGLVISISDLKNSGIHEGLQADLMKFKGRVASRNKESHLDTGPITILKLLGTRKLEIDSLIELSKDWGILYTAKDIAEADLPRELGKELVKRLIKNHLFHPKEYLHKS